MEQADFTLKSGAKLHVSTGQWDRTFTLWAAVKMVTLGQRENPEVGHIILASPDVQKALRELFSVATYDSVVIQPALFDDPKTGNRARGDYLEICEDLLEFHLRPFFLTTSLKSTEAQEAPTKPQRQP